MRPAIYFNRLGKVAALVKNLKAYQDLQLLAMTNTVTGVVAQYNAESDLQAIMGGNYVSILSATDGAVGGVLQSLAQLTIDRAVFRDNPRLNQTLTSPNVLASIQEVIRQMKVAGASVLAMTVTATPGSFVGNGYNGVMNASVKRPLDGLVLENSFQENLLFTCTADSFTGGATLYNEVFSVTGVGAETDVFAFDWPLGSNASISLLAIDGATNNGNGNLLTNSSFDNWTSGVPDNWTVTSGGSLISEDTGITFRGGGAIKIVGDGSTSLIMTQQFNNAAGTQGNISPVTQYSFCFFLRRGGGATTGTLTVDLVDQNGITLQDANGVANAFTVNLASLTTNYTPFRGVFRTAEAIPQSPNSAYIRIHHQIPQNNGGIAYLDLAGLGTMSQTYTGGPFVAVHSGASPFLLNDYGSTAITNSRGAAGTLSTWQTVLYQLLPQVSTNEILFPSAAVPTISDGLIN